MTVLKFDKTKEMAKSKRDADEREIMPTIRVIGKRAAKSMGREIKALIYIPDALKLVPLTHRFLFSW